VKKKVGLTKENFTKMMMETDKLMDDSMSNSQVRNLKIGNYIRVELLAIIFKKNMLGVKFSKYFSSIFSIYSKKNLITSKKKYFRIFCNLSHIF
jgi:hypothetical protein